MKNTETKRENTPKRRYQRSYQTSWEEDKKLHWLVYDEEQELMVCSMCREQGKNNAFTTTGSKNFNKGDLFKHMGTADHKDCNEHISASSVINPTMSAARSHMSTLGDKSSQEVISQATQMHGERAVSSILPGDIPVTCSNVTSSPSCPYAPWSSFPHFSRRARISEAASTRRDLAAAPFLGNDSSSLSTSQDDIPPPISFAASSLGNPTSLAISPFELPHLQGFTNFRHSEEQSARSSRDALSPSLHTHPPFHPSETHAPPALASHTHAFLAPASHLQAPPALSSSHAYPSTTASHKFLYTTAQNDNHTDSRPAPTHSGNVLLLKVCLDNNLDKDFYEVEVDKNNLSYENVLRVICEELEVDQHDVQKLRKLPNTIVRNDRDVRRFAHLQELELVLESPSSTSVFQLQRTGDIVY